MKARNLILCLVCFLPILASSTTDPKPNVVIIFCDDLGYGDLSSFGHPTIKTPHLDNMAREGLKLTQFYSASPVCSPSRASLLTGRYPVKNGVTRVLFPHDASGLASEEITIAEKLKELNYNTACIGKWHLGHKEGYLPFNQGFDSYYGVPYSNDMTIDPTMKLSDNILLRKGMTREMIKNIQNLDIENKNHLTPLMHNDEVIEFPADQATLTKRYTEKALDFINENKDRPFFLYLPFTMPHIPLFASEDFLGKSPRGLYGDVVEEIDWSVGQILAKLKQLELDDNTIVIFTSDNGPWLTKRLDGGSSGLLHEGKFTTWEGGVRVPTICWWPGQIQAASTSHQLGSTLDLFPTLVNLAGGKITDHDIDGYDISPVLFQAAESPRKEMAYYVDERLYAYRYGPNKIHFYSKNPLQKKGGERKETPPLLFNIETDPSERYNLSDVQPELLHAMKEMAQPFRVGPEHVTVTFEVIDGTTSLKKLMIKGSMLQNHTALDMYDDGTHDDKTAGDHIWTRTISNIAVNSDYKWEAMQEIDAFPTIHTKMKNNAIVNIDEDGNVTGQSKLLIKGSGPEKVSITFTVTDSTKSYKSITIKGTMYEFWTSLSMHDNGTNDDMIAGDHIWTRTIKDIPVGSTHRWGCSESKKAAEDQWLIKGQNPFFTVSADGKISGQINYDIRL